MVPNGCPPGLGLAVPPPRPEPPLLYSACGRQRAQTLSPSAESFQGQDAGAGLSGFNPPPATNRTRPRVGYVAFLLPVKTAATPPSSCQRGWRRCRAHAECPIHSLIQENEAATTASGGLLDSDIQPQTKQKILTCLCGAHVQCGRQVTTRRGGRCGVHSGVPLCVHVL